MLLYKCATLHIFVEVICKYRIYVLCLLVEMVRNKKHDKQPSLLAKIIIMSSSWSFGSVY